MPCAKWWAAAPPAWTATPWPSRVARTALWLEGFEEGRPLGFLDHHLQVGDALLGLTDLQVVVYSDWHLGQGRQAHFVDGVGADKT